MKLPERRLKVVVVLLLCIVTAAVYARTMWYPFSYNDDQEYIAQNIHVLSGLSLDSIRWAFTSFYAANWHPLTWLSLILNVQVFGTNPMGFHAVNVVLHVINVALLFYLLNFTTGAVWRSAFVAALFALHPLHVESVAWVTERKDVLSTLFWLLTIVCYAVYVKKSSQRMYLSALAMFALGLMSKPMLVTIPVILLLIDFWPLQRLAASSSIKRIIIEKLPFFVLSLAMSAVTICAQRQTVATFTGLPLPMRVSNALWSTLLYIWKMLFPVNLAAYYPFEPVPYGKACIAAVFLTALVFFSVRERHEKPYMLFGLLWYLVSLVPVIGLVQVGGQAMADRYTYVPLIGLFIAVSWGVAEAAERLPHMRNIVVAAAGIVTAACTIITCVQVNYWQDDKTLYLHTLAITGENSFAHNILGIAYANEGNGTLAVKEYTESLRINPDDSGTHRNLGLVFDKQLAMPAEAIEQYRIADKLEPGDPFVHYHMAKALMNMGRIQEAVGEYTKALEYKPDDPYFHNDLGMALLQMHDVDAAVRHISEALRLMPSFAQAAGNLQFALSQSKPK